MSETATFSAVQELLNNCAVGHTVKRTTHAVKITYNRKTYPTLPAYKNIELGYIRSMVRALEIDKECANRHVPNLFKIDPPPPKPKEKPAQN
jgi:hypothetical protein